VPDRTIVIRLACLALALTASTGCQQQPLGRVEAVGNKPALYEINASAQIPTEVVFNFPNEFVLRNVKTDWKTSPVNGYMYRYVYSALFRGGASAALNADGTITLHSGSVYVTSKFERDDPLTGAQVGAGAEPGIPEPTIMSIWWYPILVHGPIQVGSDGTHLIVEAGVSDAAGAAVTRVYLTRPVGNSKVHVSAGNQMLAKLKNGERYAEFATNDPQPVPSPGNFRDVEARKSFAVQTMGRAKYWSMRYDDGN